MDQQKRALWVNYLYYGSLFVTLLLLSASSIYSREDLAGSRFFFLFYSVGEAMLEVFLFIAAGWLIRTYLHRICFGLFIAFTFACTLLHFIDFLLTRIMNLSIWETLDWVFDETFENFLHLLDASGLPLWMWGAFFACMIAIPLLGILVFHITERAAGWRPFGCSLEKFIQAFFCLPIALFFWDFSASHLVPREAHHAFTASLPWKITFLRPNIPSLALRKTLPAPTTEKIAASSIEQYLVLPDKKPNIYLFIVESLREDILDSAAAPNISAFRDQSLHAKMSLANANGTPLSWFSIFHSDFSFNWNCIRQQKRSLPAPGLALLRKMGYKIRVYSAANLSYYGMDRLLFGNDLSGADSLQLFLHSHPKEAWESDNESLQAFEKDLAEQPDLREGQCVIFFWDSTHFQYSWPKNTPPRFSPVASEINFCKAYLSQKNIDAIKNGYKNAVHYIDSLFGRFLSTTAGVENSIIVFTGDHGQEFFEHGHIFHLSELNDVQTQVPIYFQLPKKPATQPALATHIDIFPTILDALAPNSPPTTALKGESLLSPHRWPYAVMARYNASRTPCEIALHNGTYKMIARFSNERDIFKSPSLRILSLRTAKEKPVKEYKNDLEGWIEQEFGDGLKKLFSEQ